MKGKFFFSILLFAWPTMASRAGTRDSIPDNRTWTGPFIYHLPQENRSPLYAAIKPPFIDPVDEGISTFALVQSLDPDGKDSPFQATGEGNMFKEERPLCFTALAAPAAGMAYGIFALHHNALRNLNLSTKNEIREDHPSFITHVDNYLQWSPAAAVIGLNLAGVRGEHPFGDELCLYGVSTIIMAGSVFGLKHITHEERPDLSDFHSFPSGHTATAFAAAEWLRAEYWHRSPWIGIAGYTAATATGVLRLYNNKHWVSDIVAGAAVGFLSTRIAYAVNPWIERHILHVKKNRENESIN